MYVYISLFTQDKRNSWSNLTALDAREEDTRQNRDEKLIQNKNTLLLSDSSQFLGAPVEYKPLVILRHGRGCPLGFDRREI